MTTMMMDGEEDVAGASGAAGGDDVDWDTIQEDEE